MTVRQQLPTGPLSLQAQTETARGYVYVAGRLAAVIERWHIVWNRCTFQVVPSSVDAFWAGYGAISHIALVWRGKTSVYRAIGGHLKDGYGLIAVPSVVELPGTESPGLRLPMT